ncbi:MAG: hypothetical protein ACPLSM_01410 [Thermosphaera sp.]
MTDFVIDPVAAFFLFVYGFVLLFGGKSIVKLIVGIGFGGFLGAAGFVLATMVSGVGGGLVVFLLMFIIGVLIGWWIFKASLSLLSGLAAWYFLTGLLNIPRISSTSLLVMIILIVIFYVLVESAITGVAILVGALLMYLALTTWAGSVLSLIIVAFLVMFRIAWILDSKGVL